MLAKQCLKLLCIQCRREATFARLLSNRLSAPMSFLMELSKQAAPELMIALGAAELAAAVEAGVLAALRQWSDEEHRRPKPQPPRRPTLAESDAALRAQIRGLLAKTRCFDWEHSLSLSLLCEGLIGAELVGEERADALVRKRRVIKAALKRRGWPECKGTDCGEKHGWFIDKDDPA